MTVRSHPRNPIALSKPMHNRANSNGSGLPSTTLCTIEAVGVAEPVTHRENADPRGGWGWGANLRSPRLAEVLYTFRAGKIISGKTNGLSHA